LSFVGCKAAKPSTGITVTLLHRGPDPHPGIIDADGLYLMTILPDRKVQIRHEQISFDALGQRVEEVFRTRAERLLLVRVEGQVEYQDVIDALDSASSRLHLRYGLMTDRSEPTPAEP
jgi:biopolymer transport protein ExbD